MEGILPIGTDEYDIVTSQQSQSFPGRDVDALRRKFNTLHQKRCPTGDPNMPWEVRQAKRVKYKIGDKASLGGGEETYNLEDNTFGGDGVIGPVPITLAQPNTSTTINQPTNAATASTSSLSTPSLRPRTPRASPNDDFMNIIKLQMMQEKEERMETARIYDREREERRQLEEQRIEERCQLEEQQIEERKEDRRSMEWMILLAITGYVGNQRKRKRNDNVEENDEE